MAVVTSLTDTKIQELMAGWEQVGYSQDEINSLVLQLRTIVEENTAITEDLNNNILPALRQNLSANENQLSDLNDNVLPDLQNNLDQHELALQNIQEVDIPSLRIDLDNNIQNVIDAPKVYTQPDEPTNPDVDDRYLVAGDVWYDSDDQNKQRLWDGVAWTEFKVDVADFSLTVKKFISTHHQIY